MKRCPKGPEPSSLEGFRIEDPSATWEAFQKCLARPPAIETPYQELLEALWRNQGGLCAYCEINLTERDHSIEHFHPKSPHAPPPNWALDWPNLLAVCRGGSYAHFVDGILEGRFLEPRRENISCDQKKLAEVLDGLILNPLHVPAFPRLFKFKLLDGVIEPDESACVQAGLPVAIVEQTIVELALNCIRLRRNRVEVVRKLEGELELAFIEGIEGGLSIVDVETDLAEMFLSHDADGNWPAYFTTIRWFLDAGAELHLHAIGYSR